MKRMIVIPALAIITLFVFSCKKNEGSQTALVSSEIIEEPVAASSEWIAGHILRLNASLMILETDTGSETDTVKFSATMTLGERVLAGDVRTAVYNGTEYEFVEVRREDGKEGLAFASQIAVGGELVVVADDRGNIYRSPRTVDVTGVVLPRKTIAVCFPETEKDGFVEVSAYHAATPSSRQNFIRATSLSARTSDIQSSILLQTAEPLENTGTDKVRKDALLESALLDYPDSVFNEEIQELVYPNTSSLVQTRRLAPHIRIVNDDNVNVRDVPDTVAGRVVGQLRYADEVTVTEETENQFTIGGVRARWYRITEPLAGWVFGAYFAPER